MILKHTDKNIKALRLIWWQNHIFKLLWDNAMRDDWPNTGNISWRILHQPPWPKQTVGSSLLLFIFTSLLWVCVPYTQGLSSPSEKGGCVRRSRSGKRWEEGGDEGVRGKMPWLGSLAFKGDEKKICIYLVPRPDQGIIHTLHVSYTPCTSLYHLLGH